nr:DUF4118 domain-containing protein [Candidatus Manganitrophus noduliformans]
MIFSVSPAKTYSVISSNGEAAASSFSLRELYTFATAALFYLMVVVILSLNGRFIPSAFVSIVAVFCLQYFFLSPVFSLGVSEPLDVVVLITFVTTAIVITRLVSNRAVRRSSWSGRIRKLKP